MTAGEAGSRARVSELDTVGPKGGQRLADAREIAEAPASSGDAVDFLG